MNIEAALASLEARMTSKLAMLERDVQSGLYSRPPDMPWLGGDGGTPLDHAFKITVSGTQVTLGLGWVNRVGSPGTFYAEQTIGTIEDGKAYWVFCSIEYQPNSTSDSISFTIEEESSDPEWEYPQKREDVNHRYIAIGRIDESGAVRYYHVGDIHYIHFDPCQNCLEGEG